MFTYKQIQLSTSKELLNSLRNIYGVGWHKAIVVLTKTGFGYPYQTESLNFYSFYLLSSVLDDCTWLQIRINREIQQKIDILMQINCYKGIRHYAKMPCRGQRTRTNARTRRRWRLKS
jgi:small subunit ribosomal protein S13